MSKRPWLLFATALGLVAVEACSDSESTPYPPATAGSAGHTAGAAGHAGSAGQAGTEPVAGATSDAGQAGESAGDSGAPGSAGSSEAGATSGGNAGTSTGGTAGVGGTLPSGGTAGVGGSNAGAGGSTAGVGGSAGTGGATTTFTLQTTTAGQVIGTVNGLSLYVFNTDTPGAGATPPVSTCNGTCLTNWPVYHGDPISVPSGLLATDFGSFDRGSGVLQSTYKGWPLYRYTPDTVVGDVKGEGLNGKWYTAKLPFTFPAGTTFSLQNTTLGKVIGTANGLSLYVLKNDTPAAGATPPVSTCSGGCLTNWPLYYGNPITVPSGLSAADFGSFDRGSGVMQSTYKGWPLYTYAPDTSIGDVKGEALGSVWYTAKSPFVAP